MQALDTLRCIRYFVFCKYFWDLSLNLHARDDYVYSSLTLQHMCRTSSIVMSSCRATGTTLFPGVTTFSTGVSGGCDSGEKGRTSVSVVS